MAQQEHNPTLEPVKDDAGAITWTVTCSCGKWEGEARTEGRAMWEHSAHRYSAGRPIPPLVHAILQAKQGREVPQDGS